MATFDENLQTLETTKNDFKSMFLSRGINYSSTEFKNYPTLLTQMEKIQPSQTKSVTPTTSAQEVTPDGGYKLAKVNVGAVTSSIDSNIVAGNIKKDVSILGVTGTFEGGITPSGTINITSNGTYDVTDKASAVVNVPSSQPTLVEKSITTNGTYNASSDNADGYSKVIVNVAGGGDANVIEITSLDDFPTDAPNGTYVILMQTPLRVWYKQNGVWIELPQTVTEELNEAGGYTITIGIPQYSEELNSAGGYTMTIGG